ncbi:MAG: bifunctional diaminohydroxyphosphoribosylaminopyrimidine deaminase/5-amino-6-(5-phosphoribosylamino)uracil reductase RibD [Elusimicrobiota bacterium]
MRSADARFMRRALTLAGRGLGRVSPNPMVGCVLVKGGRVVAEGWHRRFGGPHAEPDALRRAGARARGATVYINLEPCCYRGKTPPCTEALIRAGVRRVVAAMTDPNPKVSGKGLATLRRAGIAVTTGVLEDEARALNRAFATWVTRKRPYVILKAATSLDGRIETSARRSKWITSPEARALSRRMRAGVDAILVGVGTVLADDPHLTASPEGSGARPHTKLRGGRGAASPEGRRDPIRVILDSRLRIPLRSKALTGPGRAIIATAVAPNGRVAASEAVHCIRVPRRKGGLDLRALLKKLAAEGIASLLVEGGSRVHTAFLEAGLVDELRLFMAPRLIGGAAARTFFEGRGFRTLDASPRLAEIDVRRVGPDLLVTGRITKGKPGRKT